MFVFWHMSELWIFWDRGSARNFEAQLSFFHNSRPCQQSQGRCFWNVSPQTPKAPRSLPWGHPKSSRNGSCMVDIRNGDWEMDRTGPTDHFRPLQTPPNPPKTSNKLKNHPNEPKHNQTSSINPSLYMLSMLSLSLSLSFSLSFSQNRERDRERERKQR